MNKKKVLSGKKIEFKKAVLDLITAGKSTKEALTAVSEQHGLTYNQGFYVYYKMRQRNGMRKSKLAKEQILESGVESTNTVRFSMDLITQIQIVDSQLIITMK